MAALKPFGVALDPFAAGTLSEAEKAEIQRFIRVLDYEKQSGAEHRAVAYMMRMWNAIHATEKAVQR